MTIPSMARAVHLIDLEEHAAADQFIAGQIDDAEHVRVAADPLGDLLLGRPQAPLVRKSPSSKVAGLYPLSGSQTSARLTGNA